MKIATLTLPQSDNHGAPLNDVHAALQADIVDSFGGFTAFYGNGAWRDESTGKLYFEAVTVYSIAMDAAHSNRAKLSSLARFHGHVAGQIAVLIVHANGDSEFVDSSGKLALAAV